MVYYGKKVEIFLEQNLLTRLQMVQFECPRVTNPCASLTLGGFPFPHFQPQLLPSFLSLSGVVYYGRHGKKVEIFME